MIGLKKFISRDALISKLSTDVFAHLQLGLNSRDAASMLLSGGTTPGPLYERMSTTHFDWTKVWFAPTDERWVEPDHPDSNERLIRNSLIKKKAALANFIGLKTVAKDVVGGVKATEEKLSGLPLPFDVALLGMGEDGHFASLFPGLEDTKCAMDVNRKSLCHPIRREGDDHDRMTVTYNCILNSRQIILLFFGTRKLEIFDRARKGVDDHLPISYLLNQSNVPVSLYWAD